jgi:hypothetical protein
VAFSSLSNGSRITNNDTLGEFIYRNMFLVKSSWHRWLVPFYNLYFIFWYA